MNIKIYSDGANITEMVEAYKQGVVKGFTTNPTLMSKAGIKDYKSFAIEVLSHIKDMPISFEVFSDSFDEMYQQAKILSSLASNVYVKIPIMNTKRIPSYSSVKKLSEEKVKLNITALMTLNQVEEISKVLNPKVPSYVSIFAGRIADTGVDPIPLMMKSLSVLKTLPLTELIWASPRELLNIFQADQIGCHIITVTQDILKKLDMIDYDLNEYSLDTVKMFFNDAVVAGYKL